MTLLSASFRIITRMDLLRIGDSLRLEYEDMYYIEALSNIEREGEKTLIRDYFSRIEDPDIEWKEE